MPGMRNLTSVNRLQKRLNGIATFMDDRIVLHKKVVDFINIDNG